MKAVVVKKRVLIISRSKDFAEVLDYFLEQILNVFSESYFLIGFCFLSFPL